MRIGTLIIAALALSPAGCAAPRATVGPVAAFTANPAGGDSAPLSGIDRLELPRNAELFVRPLWFIGALHAPDDPPERTRLQIAVRLVHVDGGVSQWVITRGNRSDGAAGLPGPTRSGRYRHDFPEQTIGPLRAASLSALEVLISRVAPGPPGGLGPLRAGAALSAAPPLGTVDRAQLAEAEAGVGGGDELQLATRIPIEIGAEAAPGRTLTWLVLVEAEPPHGDRRHLARVASLVPVDEQAQHPVADDKGDRVAHTSAFAVALRVQVDGARRPPPPGGPGDRRDRGPHEDERLKRPTAVAGPVRAREGGRGFTAL